MDLRKGDKGLSSLRIGCTKFLKDGPNLHKDVPRVRKSIPRWGTTFNDFLRVLKGSNGP